MATPITKSKRYWRPGVSKCYFAETLADYHAVQRTELDTATDLTREIAGIEGWQTTSETLPTPDLGSRFVSKIPAAINADDSAINFYADSTSVDVRTLLPRDTTGFIIWLDEGDVEGQTMDVFPITVASAPKIRNLTDPAQIRIQFTVTDVPDEDQTIPAVA
jgi:hypothetical protein